MNVITCHLKCLIEAVLMKGHNIGFYEEMKKENLDIIAKSTIHLRPCCIELFQSFILNAVIFKI